MEEKDLQIIEKNIFEVDVSNVMHDYQVKLFAEDIKQSSPEFYRKVTEAAGKCVDLKLKNVVFDKLPNFYTKAIEHTDEDSGQEGNDNEYQLHGFYVIEANDNTYMNIEGVDLRVKYNHMYILPGRAIYKYNKGSNVKVITMKWKLKELPKLKENGVTYG